MLPDAFYSLKSLLYRILPFSADAMHVHIGLFLFLVVAAIATGGPRRFAIAFGVVLAVCLAGEVLDVLYDLQAGARPRWRNAIKDIANTMLWPAVWAVIGAQLTRHKEVDTSEAAGHARPKLSGEPK